MSYRDYALCMYAIVFNLRFIRIILLVFFTFCIISCANHNNRKANISSVCLGGANCKNFPSGIVRKRAFNGNLPIFDSNSLNAIKADIDLQDVAMYNIHCQKCKQNVKNNSNQRTMNMYLMKIMEEKNGLPLNNIELNAVLREYNGAQVNGFCNHVVGIINPVAKFLTKQKFVIKDSIKRNGEIVM